MGTEISNVRAKHKRAPGGVASISTTSNDSSNDNTDSEAITVGPVLEKTNITGKEKQTRVPSAVKTSGWEMTAEQALRVNFVEFEI